MTTIAIVPARGGSKGIPRKNLLLLGGMPLISRIVATALRVPELSRVIVSTEDPEIARVAKDAGAEVPFVRPASLAEDATPTLPVLQHAVQYLEGREGFRPDLVVLLYPTSPLLSPERIREGIRMVREQGLDSLVSVVEDTGHYWIGERGKYRRLYPVEVKNRQLTGPLLRENGALYICTRDLLMEKGMIVGGNVGFLRMGKYESIDIDDPLDRNIAEYMFGRLRDDRRDRR
jgi:CMP-N,N'-diacetyllegionaminic acid synthase